MPGPGDGAFLADFPAAAIDALVALTGPDADTPLASVEVRHLGGALARDAPGGGAQPSIDANYLMFAGGLAPTPELAATVRAHVRAVKDALAAWHAGYDYYNFAETPAEAGRRAPARLLSAACRRSRPPTTPIRRSSPPIPSGPPAPGRERGDAVAGGSARPSSTSAPGFPPIQGCDR